MAATLMNNGTVTKNPAMNLRRNQPMTCATYTPRQPRDSSHAKVAAESANR